MWSDKKWIVTASAVLLFPLWLSAQTGGNADLYTAEISQDSSQQWTLTEPVLLLDSRRSVGHPSWRPIP
jgi:hypothetical protein